MFNSLTFSAKTNVVFSVCQNALGEILLEMQCDSPYLCMLIPKSAVEIDICYNGFVYQGFWND